MKLAADIVVLIRPILLKTWIFLDAHCKCSNTKSTPRSRSIMKGCFTWHARSSHTVNHMRKRSLEEGYRQYILLVSSKILVKVDGNQDINQQGQCIGYSPNSKVHVSNPSLQKKKKKKRKVNKSTLK